jgi:D-glycero-D-manno-heptose 1,7-bisphosphate phosphatase
MTQKAVFLDRDDTLISDPGYINHPSQVKLLPNAGQSLAMLKKMGYLLVIVTNQSGVARGIITEEKLEEIHHHLKKLLADEGVYIDAIYHCPYHPEGTVPKYTKESDLRKPSPGMLLKAAKEMDIDLSRSWMIGDSFRDVAAGHRAGCQTILLDTPGKSQIRQPDEPEPDKRAVNLREAVNILRMYEFQQKAQSARSSRPESKPSAKELSSTEESAATGEPVQKADEPVLPPPSIPSSVIPSASTACQPTSIASELAVKPVEPAGPSLNTTPIKHETPKRVLEHKVEPPVTSQSPIVGLAAEQKAAEKETRLDSTHQILEEILHRVKSSNRYDQYDEFSVFMLLAWLVQALAAFSLVVSVWFWLDKNRGVSEVQTMIGYAIALELLVIALLMLHDKKK